MDFLKAMFLGIIFTIVAVVMGEAANLLVTVPRVPAHELEAARAMKNPILATSENIAKGKKLYDETGLCASCHGSSGRGDGGGAKGLDPPPTDFTDPEFHKHRTDGELFWVTKNGVIGTAMIAHIPSIISKEEAWLIILYLRTLEHK